MKVKKVMTKNVITIDKDRNIVDALRLMLKHNISRLPVTENNKLVGIITERDIAIKLCKPYGHISASHIYVSSLMTKKVVTMEENANVEEAARIMIEKDISGLPVVNNSDLVGIITKTDMLKICRRSRRKVSEVMTRDVVLVSPYTRVIHLRRLLIDKDISRVIVTDRGKIVGIVTERDVAEALGTFRKIVEHYYQDERIKHFYAEQIMTANPITINQNDTIADACKLMLTNEISGLPVVDDEKRLVGIVTKTDITRYVAER